MTDPGPRAARRRRRATAARSAVCDPAEPGRLALVVLLPSTEAATILLLCEAAAELTG